MHYAATLNMIAALDRRKPDPLLPRTLDSLFNRLSRARREQEARQAEDGIWSLWMSHPNTAAERVLDLATTDIAARRYDIAETRLVRLLRACPGYAEAWHKLGTLHYLLGRDEDSIAALHRALSREPRHFCALASVGEILLGQGESEGACLAFSAALRLHPRLPGIRERLAALR